MILTIEQVEVLRRHFQKLNVEGHLSDALLYAADVLCDLAIIGIQTVEKKS